jgi:hypothetical protein
VGSGGGVSLSLSRRHAAGDCVYCVSPRGGVGFRPIGRESRWVGRWGGGLWDVGRGLEER